MEVKVTLVGVGGYGGGYARELLNGAARRGARFAAGVDPSPQQSALRGEMEQAGIPIYADLDGFYADMSADLIVISAPIHLHALLTCAALQRGANVLCEKPLCATLQEAQEMADAERRAGKFVAIGYQWSFSAAIQSLKQDILAGRLGRPRRMRSLVLWPRPASYYGRNRWAGRIKTDDGRWVFDSPVSNATAHYLHNAFYLLGDARETSAQPVNIQAELYRANPIENYDTAALRCSTENGVEILFYAAHPTPYSVGPVIEYEFEDAVVRYSADAGATFTAHFRDGSLRSYGDPEGEGGHWNKLWQAVEAVRTGEPVACGIAAATPHVICVQGAQESAAEITPFPQEWVRTEARGEGDALVWVEGLPEALQQCFEQGVLPAERGDLPWAVGGRLVDLRHWAAERSA